MSTPLPTLASLERLQHLLAQVEAALPPGADEDVLDEAGEDPAAMLSPQELWDAAEAALQAGHSDEAVGLWSQVVQVLPGEAASHFGLGLALQAAGLIEPAGRQFSQSFALDPTDAACAFRLGECLLALGWTGDAHDALLAAQQLCELSHNPPEIRDMALRLSQQLH